LKADVTVRSREEIATAIRMLTDAQWVRLRKASAYFAWVYGLDGDDLRQEAFFRALAGGRKWPTNVDVIRFLIEAMRSIANGEAEKAENQIEKVSIGQPGVSAESAVDIKDSTQSQEETMMNAESDDATRQNLLGLFPNDPQARDLVDGILAGYVGEELRTLTDLDEKGYASKRRFMRRTVDRHISEAKKL
jgi:DNA-directed RNA polymerase specialized sigma24 family protein